MAVAYAHGRPDPRFAGFLARWIWQEHKDGTIDELFDHWILGRGAQCTGPR